ncbi:MAG: MFS transporter [Thermoleophilia bacterium]|nr:MFS transporter [Thermoleophilia bacterium]
MEKHSGATASAFKRPAAAVLGLAFLAFVAYVSLGLPDGLLGVAWPSMRRDFSLSFDALGALFVTTTVGYLSSSFFGGRLTARFRIGMLLAASTFLAGAALVGYALSVGWWMVVVIGIAAGLGGGGIDTALNIYVAQRHGERMMQWLHASYGVGAMLGPVIMTLSLTSLGTWRWGYVVVGCLQLVLAICFVLTASKWEERASLRGMDFAAGSGAVNQESATRASERHGVAHDVPILETLKEWRVWLSMLLFFIYMGLEVALGSWSYTLLTEARGVSPRLGGYFMASYWGIFTVGRIMAGFYTKRVSLQAIVLSSLGVACVGAVVLMLKIPGSINLAACAVIGFAIAPVLAAFLSGTAQRVGARHSANTIGMQISAMGLGAAVLPSLTGVVAERFSLQAIPTFLLAVTLLLIALYLVSLKAAKQS